MPVCVSSTLLLALNLWQLSCPDLPGACGQGSFLGKRPSCQLSLFFRSDTDQDTSLDHYLLIAGGRIPKRMVVRLLRTGVRGSTTGRISQPRRLGDFRAPLHGSTFLQKRAGTPPQFFHCAVTTVRTFYLYGTFCHLLSHDDSRDHCTERNKPDAKRQTLHDLT